VALWTERKHILIPALIDGGCATSHTLSALAENENHGWTRGRSTNSVSEGTLDRQS
jgi:hypothetical protein